MREYWKKNLFKAAGCESKIANTFCFIRRGNNAYWRGMVSKLPSVLTSKLMQESKDAPHHQHRRRRLFPSPPCVLWGRLKIDKHMEKESARFVGPNNSKCRINNEIHSARERKDSSWHVATSSHQDSPPATRRVQVIASRGPLFSLFS